MIDRILLWILNGLIKWAWSDRENWEREDYDQYKEMISEKEKLVARINSKKEGI